MKQLKEVGDLMAAYVGAGFHYGLQMVDAVHIESVVNIGVGIAIIIFTFIRSFYWIKHEGFADKE